MIHTLLMILLAYIATGVVFSEVVLYFDRKQGNRTTFNQYCNLTFFFPVVLWCAYSPRFRNKK